MLRFVDNLGNILAELPDKLLNFAMALPGGLANGLVVALYWIVTIPYKFVKSILAALVGRLPEAAAKPFYSIGNSITASAASAASPLSPMLEKVEAIADNRTNRAWGINLLGLIVVAVIAVYFLSQFIDILSNTQFGLLGQNFNASIFGGFLPLEGEDPIWLALIKGIVNTLVLVLIAIFVSSILGLVVGIARLAKHPFISRFAAAYVELFRNLPLLALMLLIIAVVLQLLPRIEEAWSIPRIFYFSNRGLAVPSIVAGDELWWLWLIFLIGGIAAALYLRRNLIRKEEETGGVYRPNLYSFALFLGVAVTSYLILSAIFSATASPPTANPSIERVRNNVNLTLTLDADTDNVRVAVPEEGATIPDGQEFVATRNITFIVTGMAGVVFDDRSENGTNQVEVTIDSGESSESVRLLTSDAEGLIARDPDTLVTIESAASGFVPPTGISFPEIDDSQLSLRYEGGFILSTVFFAALLGLVFYFSAFIAEIVRGSIQAIQHGQTEAANALGLSAYQRLTLVILPQAFTIMIPSLNNEYQNVNKDSAVAFAIGYTEILFVLRQVANERGELITLLIAGLFIFLFFNLIISTVMNTLNRLNRVAR